jgi:hypothetical protein
MKGAHVRRGRRATLTVLAVGLLTAVISAAGGSAQAAVHHSSQAPKACASKVRGPVRMGHFSGIVRAVPVEAAGCVPKTSDAANGTPPLIWHGGPVMGTPSTGAVVVTPIFWNPAGHPMDSAYKSIITTSLGDVAAASGHNTNVYSTLTEYSGSNGAINYKIKLGAPINDTSSLPASGCIVNSKDTRAIYADNSGYDACLDDSQVIAQTESVVTARNLPRDYAHIYVMYLPKHVESCFFAGSTATRNNACTINHQLSAAYCAYHNQAPSSMVYANMPFPIYDSPVGFTCGSDARFPAIETPNANADADTEISPSSHEIMESITDPDTVSGWFDSSGFENGDECAYVFGPTKGTPGQLYNQVINHHRYLTQEEFSNNDFANTGLGCLQSE